MWRGLDRKQSRRISDLHARNIMPRPSRLQLLVPCLPPTQVPTHSPFLQKKIVSIFSIFTYLFIYSRSYLIHYSKEQCTIPSLTQPYPSIITTFPFPNPCHFHPITHHETPNTRTCSNFQRPSDSHSLDPLFPCLSVCLFVCLPTLHLSPPRDTRICLVSPHPPLPPPPPYSSFLSFFHRILLSTIVLRPVDLIPYFIPPSVPPHLTQRLIRQSGFDLI